MDANLESTVRRKSGELLRSRRAWLGIGAVTLIAGAAFNWGWLVAVGAAPLLLAFAPCAAMCALGMCMKSGAGACNQADASLATATPVGTDRSQRL